jgi:hypothetical protein
MLYRQINSLTFEESIQTWIKTILSNENDFHDIVTHSPAAALPQFLRIANEYGNLEAGVVAVAALVNIGACEASNIVECFQVYNPEGSVEFEEALLKKLMNIVGPQGPYMLNDIAFARRRRIGYVYDILKKQAIKSWSIVLFAIVVKRMWRSFLEHILRPDSGYIKRVLLVRCHNNSLCNK